MMLETLSHIPVYVYVIFVSLIWVGYRRCQPRSMRVERLLVLPVLMLLLGSQGFSRLFPTPGHEALLAALAGCALGGWLGWHHVNRWNIRIDRSSRSIALPGDYLMFAVIMLSFICKFSLNVLAATHPESMLDATTQAVGAFLWSAFIAMAIGRNMHLAIRYFRTPPLAP